MPNLTKVQTSDDTLNRIQNNVQAALSQFTGPFQGGRLLQNITLSAGQSNVINHGLGRQPEVWIICDISGTSAPTLSMNSYTPAGTNNTATPPIFTGTAATLTGSISSPVVWRTAWDQNTLTLKCGVGCTVSIWVN